MRYLFHLGLFLGALVVVTSAEAQPNRRADREVTVVVAGHGHPKYDDSKHHSKHHSKHYGKHKAKKGVYRAPPGRAYGHYKGDYRYRLHDARRDLQQIVDISRAWRRAMIIRDYYRQAMIDRRLTVWIERELYEARRDRYEHRYARQIRELSRRSSTTWWSSQNDKSISPRRTRDIRGGHTPSVSPLRRRGIRASRLLPGRSFFLGLGERPGR